MTKETLVPVRNRNNGFTGYRIPDRNIWRNFAPGETKQISVEELQQLQYQPGGDYTLKNLLVVENAEALKMLNMQVEAEYSYTEADIRNVLLNGTLDQVKDFLDFAPEGAIEIAKEIAVKEELPDTRKRAAISEATGFNIDNAINVNHVMNAEDPKPVAEEKKERRAEIPAGTATTKQRRASVPVATAEPKAEAKSATPNYKVVTKN
jgi:hypothetical protein